MRSKGFAGRVERYHTWPTHQRQTVGEHSARVATIYCELWPATWEKLGYALFYIMMHDLPELWSGDLPYPVKIRYPAVRAALDAVEEDAGVAMNIPNTMGLTEYDLRQIKICDLLEMCEFGWIDYKMGNMYAWPIYDDTRVAALNICMNDDERKLVQQWLENMVA